MCSAHSHGRPHANAVCKGRVFPKIFYVILSSLVRLFVPVVKENATGSRQVALRLTLLWHHLSLAALLGCPTMPASPVPVCAAAPDASSRDLPSPFPSFSHGLPALPAAGRSPPGSHPASTTPSPRSPRPAAPAMALAHGTPTSSPLYTSPSMSRSPSGLIAWGVAAGGGRPTGGNANGGGGSGGSGGGGTATVGTPGAAVGENQGPEGSGDDGNRQDEVCVTPLHVQASLSC